MNKWQTILSVLLATSFVFAVRFYILSFYHYPPGEDAAGDIFGAKLILEGQWFATQVAPLYYLMMVIPLYLTFGAFLSVKIIMSLTPALLVVTSFVLFRKLKISFVMSIIGAIILGMSTEYSNMVSWNDGFNMFSIVFFTLFLAYFIEAIQTKQRKDVYYVAILSAICFGTHILSSFFVVATFVVYGIYVLALSRDQLKYYFNMVGLSIIGAVMFAPFYIVGGYQNLGYSASDAPNLAFYLKAMIIFGWGTADCPVNLNTCVMSVNWMIIIDVAITFASIGLLVWQRKRLNFSLPLLILLSILIISWTGIIFNTGNWDRTLYYAPIPYAVFLTKGVDVVRSKIAKNRNFVMVSVIFVWLILMGNMVYSLYFFNNSVFYYQFFCADSHYCNAAGVNTSYDNTLSYLNTVDGTSTANKMVYSTFFVTWIEAMTNFQAVGTYNLRGRITSHSYDQALYSDYIDLGTRNIGNSYYNFAINDPLINVLYLRAVGYWSVLMYVDNITISNHLVKNAINSTYQVQIPNSTTVIDSSHYVWSDGFKGSDNVSLNGPKFFMSSTYPLNASLVWINKNDVIDRYYQSSAINYSAVQYSYATNSTTAQFLLSNRVVSVVEGQNDHSISMSINNYSEEYLAPYSNGMFSLIKQLNIGYFVIDSEFDSLLWQRLMLYSNATSIAYNSGNITTFKVI